jgi:NurA-like 5'-3' nuclease
MEGQCFGRLHLVKPVEGRDALILPVDIPEWLMSRRKEVFEYLAETAKSSFPVPGYPYPLVRAHENANLSGLEMEIIGDLMSRALLGLLDDGDKEKILRYITLGRGLIKGGTRHGE